MPNLILFFIFSLIDVSEVRLKVSLETAPAQRPHGILGVWSPILSAVGNAFKIQVTYSYMKGNSELHSFSWRYILPTLLIELTVGIPGSGSWEISWLYIVRTEN